MRVWHRAASLGLVLVLSLAALPVAPALEPAESGSHASGTGTASACLHFREYGITICHVDVVTFTFSSYGDRLSVSISGQRSFGDCSGNVATGEFTGSVFFGMTLDCVDASAWAVTLVPVETGYCEVHAYMAGQDPTFGVSITAEGVGPCTLA